MSRPRRPRCFYCGVGLSRKHRWPAAPAEVRLLLAIFDRLACRRCAERLP